MSNPNLQIGEHAGHKIYFNKLSKKFSTPAMNNSYYQYGEVEKALDRNASALRAAKRKVFKLPVITLDGIARTLLGYNIGQRSICIRPNTKSYSDLYPNVAWIRAAIRELNEINHRASLLRMALRKFSICRPNYDADFDSAIKFIQDNHKTNTENALKHGNVASVISQLLAEGKTPNVGKGISL